MNLERFKAEHLESLSLQDAQADMTRYLSRNYGAVLERSGPAFTATAESRVLGCAGIETVWSNRGIAWSLLGRLKPHELLWVHRRVGAFLSVQRLRRVEMTVDAKHDAGRRWALMLGFRHEGTLRAYTPDGRDCELYARIK